MWEVTHLPVLIISLRKVSRHSHRSIMALISSHTSTKISLLVCFTLLLLQGIDEIELGVTFDLLVRRSLRKSRNFTLEDLPHS